MTSLKTKDSVQFEFETGKASMAPIYACMFWSRATAFHHEAPEAQSPQLIPSPTTGASVTAEPQLCGDAHFRPEPAQDGSATGYSRPEPVYWEEP